MSVATLRGYNMVLTQMDPKMPKNNKVLEEREERKFKAM